MEIEIIEVHSQEEFDAIPFDYYGEREIHIRNATVTICHGYNCPIRCWGHSVIHMKSSDVVNDQEDDEDFDKPFSYSIDMIYAYEDCVIYCHWGDYFCKFECHDNVTIYSPNMEAYVKAYDNCRIIAGNQGLIEAHGNCSLNLHGGYQVAAYDNCNINMSFHCSAKIHNNCFIIAQNQTAIEAHDSCKLVLADYCYATVYDDCEVSTTQNSFVSAFDHSIVNAIYYCGFQFPNFSFIALHDEATANVDPFFESIQVLYFDRYHQQQGGLDVNTDGIYFLNDYIDIYSSDAFSALAQKATCYHKIRLFGSDRFEIDEYYPCPIHCYGNVRVYSYLSNRIITHENANAYCSSHSFVEAYDNSHIDAAEWSHVWSYDNSSVTAMQNATVVAYDNSQITVRKEMHAQKPGCRLYAYDDSVIDDVSSPEMYELFDFREDKAPSTV